MGSYASHGLRRFSSTLRSFTVKFSVALGAKQIEFLCRRNKQKEGMFHAAITNYYEPIFYMLHIDIKVRCNFMSINLKLMFLQRHLGYEFKHHVCQNGEFLVTFTDLL